MTSEKPEAGLNIKMASRGFFDGFNVIVALGSAIIIGILIIWAAAAPDSAGNFLAKLNGIVNANFGPWYMYVVAFFILSCLVLAIIPATGKLKLGSDEEKPEFSRFSWVSMMFGAGIGMGLLTYSTAEPIFHFSSNPDVIRGIVVAESTENVRAAMKWSLLHWGLAAWGTYAITGLALAFFAYTRGFPLTIRSALFPLFGRFMNGTLGHLVDIIAVIATIVGASITIGYGVAQFASGIFNITGAGWIMDEAGKPKVLALLFSLVIVMIASTGSAISGVGRGIKWLSNINMVLSIVLVLFFIIFGATSFAVKTFFLGLFDYITNLPVMSLTVWSDDGTDTGKALASWQGAWTIFYWAWWVAFAPFVGMFLARVSKGRSIREFVLGAMVIPSLVCFVWFAFVGGTAIHLELSGQAEGVIIGANISAQLFETLNVILSPDTAKIMSGLVVILLITYLVTSADSAILVINTITAAGNVPKNATLHILVWGSLITAVISVLLLAGGLSAINTAMIIGALPFSMVMALMTISLFKVLLQDAVQKKG